jgi:hypothetical protein
MLHACFTSIAIYFVYTLWHFYDLFGLDYYSCKSAQCSCFTLWCVGISKNTSGNLIGVKLGLSRNLCQNSFWRWSRYRSNTASNGKLFKYKVVGNFTLNVLDIKFTWFRVRTAELGPNYCGPRWGDGNPRNYIKGGTLARGRLLHPRICSHLKPEDAYRNVARMGVREPLT